MSEYTNVEISRKLAEAGFKEKPDMGVWGKENDSHYFPVKESTDWSHSVHAYCTETLEHWLMTKPFFSCRISTLQISYRAVQENEGAEFVGYYFITGWNGAGILIGEGKALRKIDALAEVVMKVLKESKCNLIS